MASISYHISNLLEKMTSSDKDFRFMATNDLMSELQKDSIKLDDDCERKVVKMLLKLLEDKNGEVQNLAVKCLGPLIGKVRETQVELIVYALCTNMLSEKEQLRDISSIGLKTVIAELPQSSTSLASNVCKKITGCLTNAVSKDDVSVQLEALDILGDLLSRFGSLLINYHSTILSSLLPQLTNSRMAVRKRCTIAIGHLVMSCSSSLFAELMDHIRTELLKTHNTSTTRTYIQCIGAISRHAGHRIGEHMESLVPLVVQFCRQENDDELREYCIQAFESFIRRCPNETSPHVPTIMKLCMEYITYDPNYNYDTDDDENMDMGEDQEDEGESDDEYSDDDDMSWKVRRASAKCLDATISSRAEMLCEFYTMVSPALIARFKEREENVKADIFQAYISLLKQTRNLSVTVIDPDSMEEEGSPIYMLQSQVDVIMSALHRQLKEKSIKTRQGCFCLLSELLYVLPGALSNHVSSLVPGLKFCLSDKNSSSNLKIDTLSFMYQLFSCHTPRVFHPHISELTPPVLTAVGDSFYKITSEALLVLGQIVKVIRPLNDPTTFKFEPYVTSVYKCTLSRLKAADIDQEVKERAISCMGQVIHSFGDVLQNDFENCLPIFLDRLRNEITRLTTVKALTMMAESPLKINLNIILPDTVPVLATFLRKNHRALKLSTLTCLDVLIKNYGDILSAAMIEEILQEIPPLINENDLHISQLALALLTSICSTHPNSLRNIDKSILPVLFHLVQSPLLQGGALNATLSFFQAFVKTGVTCSSFSELMKQLTNPIYHPPISSKPPPSGALVIHKQAFHSIAKSVAVLTVVHPGDGAAVVTNFISDAKNPSTCDSISLFSLLAIGEIGRRVDLSCQSKLQYVIMEAFSSPCEEVKSAASYALGCVCVGNLSYFLPFILQEICSQPRRQYLLLHSLKEVISSQSLSSASVNAIKPFVSNIWDLLFKHCECHEEGTRSVVAECLGKLTLIDSSKLLPKLMENLSSESTFTRCTVITAVKFTISDQPQAIDPLLRSCIGEFLQALQDDDLNVRRVSLVMFNSAAHNKPTLIRDMLDDVLPCLYNETKTRKELIREVEMGPFKHTVDDGLDIRKAAFECMYTLLDSCLDRIDIFEFLNHLEDGLKDHYDIKMLTYLMLVRLSTLCPGAILQRLDRLVEPLRSTCTSKVKANSVKQEFEKQDELKRSAMRAMAALLTIPEAEKSPQVSDFLNQIRSNTDLAAMFDSVQRDGSTNPTSSDTMDIS